MIKFKKTKTYLKIFFTLGLFQAFFTAIYFMNLSLSPASLSSPQNNIDINFSLFFSDPDRVALWLLAGMVFLIAFLCGKFLDKRYGSYYRLENKEKYN